MPILYHDISLCINRNSFLSEKILQNRQPEGTFNIGPRDWLTVLILPVDPDNRSSFMWPTKTAIEIWWNQITLVWVLTMGVFN